MKTAIIDIEDVAYGGDGVGRLDGQAVFVPFTIPGERVNVRITENHKRFLRAEVSEIVTPSPDRVEPPCPLFGTCGGCHYQHMQYAAQCRIKTAQVQALCERLGGWQGTVNDMVPADSPWQYRTRMTLHGPGTPAYIARDHTTRLPILECPIVRTSLNDALGQWNEKHPTGLRDRERLTLRQDADGVVHVIGAPETPEHLEESIGTRRYQVPANSFFQVNGPIASKLVRQLVSAIRSTRATHLVDAYGGVGVFSIEVAGVVQEAVVIESDARAVKAATHNRRQHQAQHLRLVTDRVETALPRVLNQLPVDETVCLLDPPRKGCPAPVLDTLIRKRPRSILYVACAPDCLARDLRRLTANGYRLQRVTPFDMFPQTASIEVLAECERSPS